MRSDVRLMAQLIEDAMPAALTRAMPLHWSVSPENMPYAVHAGVQPELVTGGEVIVRRLAKDSEMLERGSLVHAVQADDEWTFQPASSIPV